MGERLVIYSCRDKEPKDTHDRTLRYLREFDKKIREVCGEDAGIEAIDGNEHFPARRAFLRATMLDITRDGACNHDLFFVRIQDEWYHVQDSCDPVCDKTLIVAHEDITSLGRLAAHGIVDSKDKFAFLVRDYRNILWHEAAHLFGAKEHYENIPVGQDRYIYPAAQQCEDHELCLMQWNPGNKPCHFCDRSIAEMRQYFATQKEGHSGLSKA